jgi:glycosyltransferase involved in cell wall biosynthesis
MREIFLLCEYATLNGGERSMLATLDGLSAAGFAPVVMGPPRGPLADALAAHNVELLPFECCAADGRRLTQGRLREELSVILRRRRPALLHANSLAMGRLSGPVVQQLSLPSLGHLRDIVRLSAQAIADLNCHTRLLAVSHATREFHVGAELAAEKVHVVYNGVDLDEFCPRSPTGYLHRELGLPEQTQLIGTIGQIGLRKGQDVLLRAAAKIVGQLPNVHYVIVGQRHSDKDESRQFERDLHRMLGTQVHFVGVRADVCRLLSELTLLVHPARQEPLGRVLLEAAAAGVAMIATDVGGTPEIFPPEAGAARLVPPDDPAALGDALLELLGDPAMRHRLGVAARRRAEQQFGIQMSVGNLLQHYRVVSEESGFSKNGRELTAPGAD